MSRLSYAHVSSSIRTAWLLYRVAIFHLNFGVETHIENRG